MVDPSSAGHYYQLAMQAMASGDQDEAERHLLSALDSEPIHVPSLAALGRIRRSPELLRRALELLPRDLNLACDLADVFSERRQLKKAALLYEHVLESEPAHLRALYGGGCAALAAERFASAETLFSQAVGLQPDWLEARHNQARSLYELGEVSPSFAEFERCGHSLALGGEHSRAMLAVIAPGVPEVDQAGILRARRRWVQTDLGPPSPVTFGPRRPGPIRIGYISSFFHRDQWMKPVWAVINRHNRAGFQIHLFSDSPAETIRHGYRPHNTDCFFDTSALSNDEFAELLLNTGIDIAVDLNGYSNMRRLPMFSRKLAPVVIAWFNMYATSGFDTIDYLIGDEHVVLPEEESLYTERVLRVQGSYLAFNVDYPVPEIAPRPAHSQFVFGALASQYKITDPVVASWSRILHGCPAASLLIKNKALAVAENREHLLARFQRHGIAAERLQLEGPEEHFEFLKAYGRLDLALDTFPYNGGTTTTEALWQGVPVLTFSGDRWASRTSASLLHAAGLSEFVTKNQAGYEAAAVRIALDKSVRELRDTMRSRLLHSAACNSAQLASQLEAIFQTTKLP